MCSCVALIQSRTYAICLHRKRALCECVVSNHLTLKSIHEYIALCSNRNRRRNKFRIYLFIIAVKGKHPAHSARQSGMCWEQLNCTLLRTNRLTKFIIKFLRCSCVAFIARSGVVVHAVLYVCCFFRLSFLSFAYTTAILLHTLLLSCDTSINAVRRRNQNPKKNRKNDAVPYLSSKLNLLDNETKRKNSDRRKAEANRFYYIFFSFSFKLNCVLLVSFRSFHQLCNL